MKKKQDKSKLIMGIIGDFPFSILNEYEGKLNHILIMKSGMQFDVWPTTGTVRVNNDTYHKDKAGEEVLRANFQNLEPSPNERITCLEERVDLLSKQLEDTIELLREQDRYMHGE